MTDMLNSEVMLLLIEEKIYIRYAIYIGAIIGLLQ